LFIEKEGILTNLLNAIVEIDSIYVLC
jgi:hypothetical protein